MRGCQAHGADKLHKILNFALKYKYYHDRKFWQLFSFIYVPENVHQISKSW